jgi:uncharacterized membrane protein YgcG
MGFDDRTLAAALVSMAVKGHLEIEDTDGDYAVRRLTRDGRALSGGEAAVARRLFRDGPQLAFEQANHARLRAAESALTDFLQAEYEGAYFRHNRGYFVVGAVLSLLLVVASAGANVVFGGNETLFANIFLAVWLSIWSFGCYKLGTAVVNTWRAARRGFANTAKAVFLTIFSLPFLAGLIGGTAGFIGTANLAFTVPLVLILVFNALFYELLKSSTRAGRALLDEIEGFALYLGTAEGPRLEAMHPPDLTPEHFEEMLPYAVALDLEVPWSERFEAALAAGLVRGVSSPAAYRPRWYRGTAWRGFGAAGLAGGIGSAMAGSIASASTPPGRGSSGVSFGGGGFSGGGGGGGGGSGW